MRRTLNRKAFLWTLVILLVAATGMHALHTFQVLHNSGRLLELADKAKAANDLEQALTYYEHYLAYVPGDNDARIRFGLTLEQQAATLSQREQVVQVFEAILQSDPGRRDIRFRLVNNQIQLLRFRDAEANLQKLLPDSRTGSLDIPASDDKAKLEHMLGWCQQEAGEFVKADASFRRCFARPPPYRKLRPFGGSLGSQTRSARRGRSGHGQARRGQ